MIQSSFTPDSWTISFLLKHKDYEVAWMIWDDFKESLQLSQVGWEALAKSFRDMKCADRAMDLLKEMVMRREPFTSNAIEVTWRPTYFG